MLLKQLMRSFASLKTAMLNHTMISFCLVLPYLFAPPPITNDDLKVAPKVENNRIKVKWNDDNLADYQAIVQARLPILRESLQSCPSKSSFSLLLQLSNSVLLDAAIMTNKTIVMDSTKPIRRPKLPKALRLAQVTLKRKLKYLRMIKLSKDHNNLQQTQLQVSEARRHFRFLERKYHHVEDLRRDRKLFTILSSNPYSAFRSIKSSKSSSNQQVPFLKVGSITYMEDMVPDGFFHSISHLKSRDYEISNLGFTQDYQNILKICQNKKTLPAISITDSNRILFKMKPHVCDFFSITAQHYINAGKEGLLHFNFLLNYIIDDVNS